MKIVVAVKQVPERDAPLQVSADGRSLDTGDANFTMNEPDAYALEEALQLRERVGQGEVVVLTAGPERAQSTLREALAKGADRAIHVLLDEDSAVMDPLATATLLAAAIAPESPDLVLTGLQSDDLGAGQTGVVLAEKLGVPHTTLVLGVEVLGGNALRVKRELEDGWFQHVELPTPAVLTIQSGGNKLRYATLMGIKKARAKEVREETPGSAPQAVVEVVRVSTPQRIKRTEFLTGDPKSVAAQLVEKLKFEAKVL